MISFLIKCVHLFSKLVPEKCVKITYLAILILWITLIVILDMLTTDFGGIRGAVKFTWIDQVVCT